MAVCLWEFVCGSLFVAVSLWQFLCGSSYACTCASALAHACLDACVGDLVCLCSLAQQCVKCWSVRAFLRLRIDCAQCR